MKWFTKKVQGSIALFLSMILLLLVILEGFLIDGSKVLAGKMMMSAAGDMALNAGLTYYDDALRRVYGLFATSKTEAELTENLEKYFKETLGEVTGNTEETGYTDQFLNFIEKSIKGGWNEEEAQKLLDLSVTSFSASGMKNSALSDQYVIKNQILEYMKYRGPASLGYGMLEKIFAFKDLNKQQKVIQTKLDFEESMDDVQKACEEAYRNAVAYNALLNRLTPDHVEAESDEINHAIYEAVIATFSLNAVRHDAVVNGRRFDQNWLNKSVNGSGHDVERALNRCSNYRQICAIYSGEGGYSASEGTYLSNINGDFQAHITAAMQAIQLVIGYVEDFENYRNLYTTWMNWQEYYPERREELEDEIADADDEDDDVSDLEDELEELIEQNERYEEIMNGGGGEPGVFKILGTDGRESGVITALFKIDEVLKKDIDSRMKLATDKLHTIYQDAENLEKTADLTKQALEDVIAKMDVLKGKGTNWNNAISNLPEGDVKTSMQSDYDNKSKDLDRTKIRNMEEFLENGKVYAMELENDVTASKTVAFGMKDGYGNSSYSEYLNNNWKGSAYRDETNIYKSTSFRGFRVSEWTRKAELTNAMSEQTFTFFFLDGSGGQRGSGNWMKMDLKIFRDKWNQTITTEHEFFQYLQRICPTSEATKAEQESAKQTKNKLFEKAENVNFDGTGITSNKMDGGGESKSFTSTQQGADDKTVSKNAKENSKASASFLENVGKLLTKGRDKLYISEYATNMFSYYTVDKPDGKAIEKTLSGYEITEKRNYLYKAEVEYILWGNADPKADVRNTLTTIFGIRFLLNMLYAFTGDPEIRSTSLALATSIAGWTGFGVPLVQSVIIIGFALAETALDLEELKKGESVPIYKSENTWAIKPSGMGRTFKEEVGDAINRNAKKVENQLFEKLNTLTAEKVSDFNTTLTKYSESKIDEIASTASASVLTPLEERLIGLVNVISPSETNISSAIDSALSGVESTIASEPDSVLKEAKMSAVSVAKSQCKSMIVSAIQDVQNRNDLTPSQISDRISGTLEQCKTRIQTYVKSKVSGKINSLTTELKNSIDAGSKQLQEDVSEKLDQYLMRIDCGVSFADIPETEDSKKVHTSGADVLTMDYSEYLWLFIAVTCVSDGQEAKILNRIGNLIEKNMKLDTNPDKSANKNFSMAGAYTFIGIEAKADIKTTFFSIPVPTGNGSTRTYGSNTWPLGYRSLIGY